MKMPEANRAEFEAVYGLLRYAVMQSKGDPDAEPFRTYADKLKRAGAALLCRHCGSFGTRRMDRYCDACNAYRHKYGRLPEPQSMTRAS